MREIDCSIDVAELIKKMIDDKILLVPGSISLEQLKNRTGYSNNLIGKSFQLIERILLENGYSCRKCGTPRIIQISKKL